MPTAKIVRVGIPSAEGLVWPLDNHIGALELWVDSGEVVNATDSGFLEEGDTSETVGEAAVRMRAIRKLAPIAMVGMVVAVVAFSAYSSLTTPTLAFSFRVYWASPSVYTPGTTPPSAYLQINSTGTDATTYYYAVTYNSTSGEIVAAQGTVAVSELAPFRAYVYIPIPRKCHRSGSSCSVRRPVNGRQGTLFQRLDVVEPDT